MQILMDDKRNTWLEKIKRTLTSILPVSRKRIGACKKCGACCRLPVACAFLRKNKSGSLHCSIYAIRPLNCRKYPRIKNEWITEEGCGFSFD
jgi:uncharacterized protein